MPIFKQPLFSLQFELSMILKTTGESQFHPHPCSRSLSGSCPFSLTPLHEDCQTSWQTQLPSFLESLLAPPLLSPFFCVSLPYLEMCSTVLSETNNGRIWQVFRNTPYQETDSQHTFLTSRKGNRNQEINTHPVNTTAYINTYNHSHQNPKCLDIITKTQLLIHQDHTPSHDLNNPTIVGPKKCNVIETQDKDFEIVIMNMFEYFKEEMNKFMNKIYKTRNKQQNKMKKLYLRHESRNRAPKLRENWK